MLAVCLVSWLRRVRLPGFKCWHHHTQTDPEQLTSLSCASVSSTVVGEDNSSAYLIGLLGSLSELILVRHRRGVWLLFSLIIFIEDAVSAIGEENGVGKVNISDLHFNYNVLSFIFNYQLF